MLMAFTMLFTSLAWLHAGTPSHQDQGRHKLHVDLRRPTPMRLPRRIGGLNPNGGAHRPDPLVRLPKTGRTLFSEPAPPW